MSDIIKWQQQTVQGEKLIVIGAGSLGKLAIDVIRNSMEIEMQNIAILDDDMSKIGGSLLGIPVIGDLKEIEVLSNDPDTTFVIAIANNKIRKELVENYSSLIYRNIISKDAIISPFARIGHGCIIMPGAVIDPDAIIMDHVIINKTSTIAHDSILNDFSQISPGVNLGGNVNVGECSFIGLGAAVLPNITITRDVVIGAGAVVTKDINIPETVYVGNPARRLVK